jgi:hypothetical protein
MGLTPEVAAAIEAAALAQADESHDPAKFGCMEHGGYRIQVERFSDILQEIHPLHEAHWIETEKHRHGLELNPDYPAFLARERAGSLIQFTVRSPSGELVGNLRMFLATSLHTQTRYASEDTVYIKPEHRGGFTVMALLRFAEGCIRAVGITEIRFSTKHTNNVDALMRRAGYEPVATEFVKFLEK